MFRKSSETTLKEAINLALESLKLKDKYLENTVVIQWEEIMGRTISSRTSEIYISNKKLYIRLTSSVLKQELAQSKDKIIELINEKMEAEVVKEVIFM